VLLECFEVEKPKILPPNLNIALSKESLVRVLGSKKSVARIFPLHLSAKANGFSSIDEARLKIS